jgi:hypothetical protein
MVASATLVTDELIYEARKQIKATQARHGDDLRKIKERLGIL